MPARLDVPPARPGGDVMGLALALGLRRLRGWRRVWWHALTGRSGSRWMAAGRARAASWRRRGRCGTSPILGLFTAGHQHGNGGDCPVCGVSRLHWDRLATPDEIPAAEVSKP